MRDPTARRVPPGDDGLDLRSPADAFLYRFPSLFALFDALGPPQGGDRPAPAYAGQPISALCRDAGVDARFLLYVIRVAEADKGLGGLDWSERPLPDLILYLLVAHHDHLKRELPRIGGRIGELLWRSESGGEGPLPALRGLCRELRDALYARMRREEAELFPWILRRGPGPWPGGNADDAAGTLALVARVRELTGGYQPLPSFPDELAELYRDLGALDRRLGEHIRLERDFLFPRAAA